MLGSLGLFFAQCFIEKGTRSGRRQQGYRIPQVLSQGAAKRSWDTTAK